MTERAAATSTLDEPHAPGLYAGVLVGLLLRDLRVLLGDLGGFVVRTVANPLLFVFVFAYVLPKIGQGFTGVPGGASFATVLVPGLLGVAVFFAGITAVALPLSVELGRAGALEDRLMAPVPVWLVALEKVVFSALQSVLSAALVFPIVYLIPATSVVVTVHSWPLLIGILLLASLTAGALGLFLGTVVRPEQIGLLFSVVLTPVTFLGCVYYPWAALEPVPWLQVAGLLNPLVYVSEGLRAALTPQLPHMPVWSSLGALLVLLILLTLLGVRGFVRRVVT